MVVGIHGIKSVETCHATIAHGARHLDLSPKVNGRIVLKIRDEVHVSGEKVKVVGKHSPSRGKEVVIHHSIMTTGLVTKVGGDEACSNSENSKLGRHIN